MSSHNPGRNGHLLESSTQPVASDRAKAAPVSHGKTRCTPRTLGAIVREYTDDSDVVRARHTKRLEAIYRQVLIGHRRSRNDEEVTRRTAHGDNADGESTEPENKTSKKRGGPKYKVETTTRERPGDIRFLIEARQVLAEIRRIWGIDAVPTSSERINDSISKIAFDAASDADLSVLNGAFETLQRLAAVGQYRQSDSR
jgi:hypothetical protein